MAALVTYTDIQDATGKTFTTAQQAQVANLIARVEAMLKAELLDWTADPSETYEFDGSGFGVLYLGRWLNSATSVTVDGDALDADEYVIRGHYLKLKSGVWSEGVANVEIAGSWGWSTTADAQADFVLMETNLLLALFSGQFGREIQSESVGNVSFSYVAMEKLVNADSFLRSTWAKYMGAWVA